MPENPPERTYKHQVPADVFVEAFTTPKWTAAQTKKFNALGIERLSGDELKNRAADLYIFYFYGNDECTLLTNAQVTGNIIIDNRTGILPHWCIYQSKLPEISLTNCQWGEIDTEKIKKGTNINIIDSTTGDFIIENSTTGGFSIFNSTTGDSIIENSTTVNFSILNNSATGDFIISNSTTGDFIIENSTTGGFSIFNNRTTGDFFIENSTTRYFNIRNTTTGDFSIFNNSTTGDFRIEGSTMGDFSISNSKSPLWDIEGVFASFYFSKATIGQCKLINCNIPELTIQNECAIELYVSNNNINHINFEQLTLGKSSVVSFSNTYVYTCNMNEFAMLGNLYFRGVKKAKSVFKWPDRATALKQKFSPEEIEENSEKYQRIKNLFEEQRDSYTTHTEKLLEKFKQATFRISQSSLGKTEFTECNLAGFSFEYNNSKITEVFISGGSVPESGIKILGEEEETKGWFQQKVSIYNQLKKVFAAQGDVYYESVFHAQTSHHQLYLLRYQRKEKSYNWYQWLLSEETYDIITFRLNQYSNKHGASWGRALGFVLILPFFIYFAYLKAAGLFYFDIGSSIDWDLLGNYFTVLNPTHKTDFMPKPYEVNYNFGTNFLDFLGRIVVGYGIFQFISAFRKHGKKG